MLTAGLGDGIKLDTTFFNIQLSAMEKSQRWKLCALSLGGGFKYFLFSSLFGEMIQFDQYFSDGLKPPTSSVLLFLFGLPPASRKPIEEALWESGLVSIDRVFLLIIFDDTKVPFCYMSICM